MARDTYEIRWSKEEAQQKIAAQAQKKIEDAVRMSQVSVDEIVAANNIVSQVCNNRFALPPRTQTCNWATLYLLFDRECPGDIGYITMYLNSCDLSIQKQDLNQVINDLEHYIENPDNKRAPTYQDTCDYYAFLQQEKNNIPDARLSEITELSYRVLFTAKCPTHEKNANETCINKQRGRALSKKNAKYRWGELLASAADAVLGFAVGLVSGITIAATVGLASPIAIPLGTLGLLGMFGSVGRMRDDWKRFQKRHQGLSDRANKVFGTDKFILSRNV